ncbi:MAG TPA: methyltransferase domain-containing protein [Candidatus Thermoplasmatota archaeon]|nr:methyltransferase domain-containing protein [Candidatus Thermoplasmatota archaeon]
MEDVPGFTHLMRSFYAASLGQRSPRDILEDVARHRALLDAVLAPVSPRPGRLVVDVGTGAGLLALAAGRRFPDVRVLGVDVAAEAIDRARDAARDAGLANVRFEEGFAEALQVPDGAADTVCALAAFNLFPDKEGALREARRALGAGGTLVIADAFRVDADARASGTAVVPSGPGPLTTDAWRALLGRCGLEPIASHDVTDVRRALDASRAWLYPPLVDGFSFRVESARRD